MEENNNAQTGNRQRWLRPPDSQGVSLKKETIRMCRQRSPFVYSLGSLLRVKWFERLLGYTSDA